MTNQRPLMEPGAGARVVRYVGDRIEFRLGGMGDGGGMPPGWVARLRTNLGRARVIREEVIQSYTRRVPEAGASWRDISMRWQGNAWTVSIALTEVGYFQAKAYAMDPQGRQHWPEGANVGLSVHPNAYRTANSIYCAFPRMFGETKTLITTVDPIREQQLAQWDERGYAVIPPSGKLRELRRELPHIMETLGCRILHLLPIHPTPTTYARFGRFGSPYAAGDLTLIDPALVEFDRRSTGVEQFAELTEEVHARGGRIFLDIVMNHTGWGSRLQEEHPEWFVRERDRTFVSPGAWGVTWEDLVELNHGISDPWNPLAEMLLVWCRRGVDGFRCDAGYKVPVHAWRYITARVRQEFPNTVFLLEGLGGSWEATEQLLTEGGMQWAYSELFQNYSGAEVAWYLDYALLQSQRVGTYAHYSETHDNERLAAKGRVWSLMRNRLCALTSVSGAFGFTCGVEWLARERINVHSCRGLSWGQSDHVIRELATLNRVLSEHPCFYDHATLRRLSAKDATVFALDRRSEEGLDRVLVLVNTDAHQPAVMTWAKEDAADWAGWKVDLLGQSLPAAGRQPDGSLRVTLGAGAAYCLAATTQPAGLSGAAYRYARARAAWAFHALARVFSVEELGAWSWRALAETVDRDPANFLAELARDASQRDEPSLKRGLGDGAASDRSGGETYRRVVSWRPEDATRVLVVPEGHWVLLRDRLPFRAQVSGPFWDVTQWEESIRAGDEQIAAIPPGAGTGWVTVRLERLNPQPTCVTAQLFYPGAQAPDGLDCDQKVRNLGWEVGPGTAPLVLLTNGRGGMARLGVGLGEIQSKYDAALAANLHPEVPVDRHVLAKRIRVWCLSDGFVAPLDDRNRVSCAAGPPARWRFIANAGDGRAVEIQLEADMLAERNCTVFRFARPGSHPEQYQPLPDGCEVRLIVRVDLEDRNFHWETRRNSGAEHHFGASCRVLGPEEGIGFAFAPATDRRLVARCDRGRFHVEPEWQEHVPHPVEGSRGQTGEGDAYSPGWFECCLALGESVHLCLSADPAGPEPAEIVRFAERRRTEVAGWMERAACGPDDRLGRQLATALGAFVVRRREAKTVIAGYPWFLDWGRDSLICARGLMRAGWLTEVGDLLKGYGQLEQNGTLPNSLHGDDASNRDTVDAPLWFGIVCEEWAQRTGADLRGVKIDARGRDLVDVLGSIAEGFLRGTPNGIRVDPHSGLVWSPSHFTWMDTNHPAGTPREGYAVEIQVLWVRLLRLLASLGLQRPGLSWQALATEAEASFLRHFWQEDLGWMADGLWTHAGGSAAGASVDSALRSNGIMAVSLGLLKGRRAQRCVESCQRYLVVPGALRSLAPLPVALPLPIRDRDGRLLNHPSEPYWGRYEGDEDTRRKPAYHNGTAWVWTFPSFCEALALAWNRSAEALAAARSYLLSVSPLLSSQCLGQLPEIVDGDAPHRPRGCDAQAWSVTEAFRVWSELNPDSE